MLRNTRQKRRGAKSVRMVVNALATNSFFEE
jgi:hypothetical protein